MSMSSLLADLSGLDYIALIFLIGGWAILGHFTEHPPRAFPSVTTLMRQHRRDWMHEFLTREPRIFDASIIDSLRQGTSFFASACMIAIGGCVALAGSPDKLQGFAGGVAGVSGSAVLWQFKITVIIIFLTNAALKFAWSNRLFGYCAILMAAVPNDPAHPDAEPRAMQAAGINIQAARNFNNGLRSIYFGLGALGWLLGPEVLILTTAATIFVGWRREFASLSRQILLEKI